jgi:hypothetical protein
VANGIVYIGSNDHSIEPVEVKVAHFLILDDMEVDVETGKVDVLDVASVHDVGKAINRGMVTAQMCGGVAMGIGYGLLEEFEIDGGIPKQLNFDEYLIPTSKDIPRIKTIIVENEDLLAQVQLREGLLTLAFKNTLYGQQNVPQPKPGLQRRFR